MFFTNVLTLLLLPLATFTSATFIPKKRFSGIVSPTAGTLVNPGAPFDFKFDTMADYGISSYNYTVFIFTDEPTSFSPSETFGSGYYLGRFAEPNYPGNPNPPNRAPAQLTMPDFSKNPGGFGSGGFASDKKIWLAVLEEYANGQRNVGLKLNFAIQELVYNGTKTA